MGKRLRFTIRGKVIVSYLVVTLIFVLTGAFSFVSFGNLETESSLVQQDLPVRMAASHLLTDLLTEQTGVRAYLLTGQDADLSSYKEGKQQLDQDVATIRQQEAGQPLLKKLVEEEALPQIQNIQAQFDAQIQLVQGGQLEAARSKVDESDAAMTAFQAVNAKIMASNDQLLQEAWNSTNQRGNMSRVTVLISMGVSVAVAIVTAVLLIRSIVLPLRAVKQQLKEIAEGEGDLTRELHVKSQDEFGELAASFNMMTEQLRHMIGQVAFGAEQVASAAEELSASAEQTAQATEHIATTIQEVVQGNERQVMSVEESMGVIGDLTLGVSQIAENAQQVSDTAVDTTLLANRGNESIQTVVSQMQLIDGTIHGLAREIEQLGESSQEIGQIIEVITGIAAQTNLLALNAAIEAARAGEHGRGFSVVADEVRKLAEQSVASAQRITGLITAIQEGVQRASESMAAGTREVTTGLTVVREAGASFEQIVAAIGEVASQVQQVSSATEQMSAGTQQMERSIVNIASIAEESATGTYNVSASAEQQLASMEEITSSSFALSQLAEELEQLVGRFKV